MLANGVHYLPQQVLLGDIVSSAGISRALHDIATKSVNLVRRHGAEVVVERVAGFELFAVDQKRVWAGQRVASGLIEITEESEPGVLERSRPVRIFAMESRYEIVHQL
jgi:hypothetical protein